MDTDNIPGDISQLGINCTTALRRAKIDTIDELIKHTEEDLLLVRGLSKIFGRGSKGIRKKRFRIKEILVTKKCGETEMFHRIFT